MATVFLSYSSRDRALAESIAAALLAHGHEIRFDAGLEVGDEWRRDLLETLHGSDALLVLLTKDSLESQFVAAEIGAARALGLEKGMFILPVIVGDLSIPAFVQDIFSARLSLGETGAVSQAEIDRVAKAIHRGIVKHYARLRGKYPRIFISHRHKDKEMVAALIALLEAAFGIGPGDLRCTSVHPYKLPAGERTPDRLRAEIGRARAVLGILTPDTKESSYVLFELGASWSQRALTLPLLAKGATQADLPPPISDRHPIHLADDKDCRQLLEDLGDATGWKLQPDTSRIEEKIRALTELARAS
jgi:hypothetical protein